jgi:hypothetical protein
MFEVKPSKKNGGRLEKSKRPKGVPASGGPSQTSSATTKKDSFEGVNELTKEEENKVEDVKEFDTIKSIINNSDHSA